MAMHDDDAIYDILRRFQGELAALRGDVNELRAECVALREQERAARVEVEDLNAVADALGRRVRRLERSLETPAEPLFSAPPGVDREPLAPRRAHAVRGR